MQMLLANRPAHGLRAASDAEFGSPFDAFYVRNPCGVPELCLEIWTDFLDTRAGVSGGCYELAASG